MIIKERVCCQKEHTPMNKLQERFYDTEDTMIIKRGPMNVPIYERDDESKTYWTIINKTGFTVITVVPLWRRIVPGLLAKPPSIP
jgi:hypothetical protein